MPRVLPVALASLALLAGGTLAACGSSGGGSTSTASTGSVPPATTAATPPATTPSNTGGATADTGTAGTAAITMQNISFNPNTTTVKVGEKVVWTNKDQVQHNVVADTGATFKSQLISDGQTYSFTPTKAGTITYECTIHPGMTGTLKVISGP